MFWGIEPRKMIFNHRGEKIGVKPRRAVAQTELLQFGK
jgi:hypothetical protein